MDWMGLIYWKSDAAAFVHLFLSLSFLAFFSDICLGLLCWHGPWWSWDKIIWDIRTLGLGIGHLGIDALLRFFRHMRLFRTNNGKPFLNPQFCELQPEFGGVEKILT